MSVLPNSITLLKLLVLTRARQSVLYKPSSGCGLRTLFIECSLIDTLGTVPTVMITFRTTKGMVHVINNWDLCMWQ